MQVVHGTARQQFSQTTVHFYGGALGKGHGQDLATGRPVLPHEVDDAVRQGARLASPRASHYHHGPALGFHGLLLGGVESA